MRKIQSLLPSGPVCDAIISFSHSWKRLGYFPRIHKPRTLNEHLLKEKLKFSRNSELANFVSDKINFKNWLTKLGLNDLIVKTINVFDNFEKMKDYLFPNQCIIKPTHSSGQIKIIKESSDRKLNNDEKCIIKSWFFENYYLRGREPNYRGIKPQIIIEELLLDENGTPPFDYKVFCLKGMPFLIQVDIDRFTDHKRQLYTPDWKLLPFCMYYPISSDILPIPSQLPKALQIASKLSRYFRLSRIDLYLLGSNEIRAGEITFFPGNCAEKFTPEYGDFYVGKLIDQLDRNS